MLLHQIGVWVHGLLAEHDLSEEWGLIDHLNVAGTTGGGAQVHVSHPLPSGHAALELKHKLC